MLHFNYQFQALQPNLVELILHKPGENSVDLFCSVAYFGLDALLSSG